MEFIEARQIGNMLVMTGQWTFGEGLFPDSGLTVTTTADVTHLRDGKIWRVRGSPTPGQGAAIASSWTR